MDTAREGHGHVGNHWVSATPAKRGESAWTCERLKF